MLKEKKFTSKRAFIENKGLKRDYDNRCYASDAARRQQDFERDGFIACDPDQPEEDDDLAA